MNCWNELKSRKDRRSERSLRRSFLHFHFFSAVHIWFISYIINTHFFHSGFIAQLVEHRTGNREVTGSNPVEVLNFFFFFFFFSGFFTQLLKLRSLRRSFLHFLFKFSTVYLFSLFWIYIRYRRRMNKDEARGVLPKLAKEKHILLCQNNNWKNCEAVIMDRAM